MKSIDEFKQADGSHDWAAYRVHEIAEGHTCYQCKGLAALFAPGHPQLCYACKSLEKDSDEVTHNNFIRCPKCSHRDQITEWDCDYSDVKYSEGEHKVLCGSCDYEYEISTHASYSYTSPPLIDGTDE